MSETTEDVASTATDANRITPEAPIQNEETLPEIIINGMPFTPVPGVDYQHNYPLVVQYIKERGPTDPAWQEINVYRTLMKEDLWFLVYFGLNVTIANHKWWVDCCREVEEGPQSETIDLWSRDHGKSTIITMAETIQYILKNQEKTTCILSYTKDTAKAFYGPIKQHLEGNAFLKACFPDVLWSDTKESTDWSDSKLTVRRNGKLKEATLEYCGLTDGMLTGRHFDRLIYDDIVTHDMASSTTIMDRVKSNFDMSMNLGKDGTVTRVIGTFYHHEDVLVYLRRKMLDGKNMYFARIKPATEDGTYTGKSVWLSEERLAKLKVNRRMFATQYLLDPTPKEDELLPWECVHRVRRDDVPRDNIKLMTVDPSGGVRTDGREADAWGILVVAVDPVIEDAGMSKVYILDGCIKPMRADEGLKKIVDIYMRNGWIHRLGVEKVGMQSAPENVSNALRAKGRFVTEENGMMVILRPGKSQKVERIERLVGPPLRHGLIHIVDGCPEDVVDRLKAEMEKFPLWGKDDGLDALAYVYDLLSNYKLPLGSLRNVREVKDMTVWDIYEEMGGGRGSTNKHSWMKN